jgi:UDP-N-acetylglucosamine:LPS N-acetylglucosamine transferase
VGATLVALLTNPGRREEMRKACASLGPANGAERVAAAVREVAAGLVSP